MQKSFNTKLFNSLIDFNLFLHKSKEASYFNKHLKKAFYPRNSNSSEMFILEPLQLIKALKQIIRLLQHLKNQPNPALYVFSSEIILSEWIQFLLEKKKLSLNNNVVSFTTNPSLKNNSTLSFLIGADKTASDIKKLFMNSSFLVSILNNKTYCDDFGAYHFQNDINDWKRILFFFILLKQTYKKN
jgi:hypothetical protein